jgi:hypothetical protein
MVFLGAVKATIIVGGQNPGLPMLEAQINQAKAMIESAWAVMKDRNIPLQENISSVQITAWREGSDRLIARMFGADSPELGHFRHLYEVERIKRLINQKDARKNPDWDIAYWIDYFEMARSYLVELDGIYADRKSLPRTVEVIMGGKYHTGQAAVVGRGNVVVGNTFYQLWQKMDAQPDLNKLAGELAQLRTAMRSQAKEVEDDLKVAAVAEAEKAAKEGNGPATLEALKSAGGWALGVAEKIGVGVAIAAIKTAMGI